MPRNKKERIVDMQEYDFTIHVTAERRTAGRGRQSNDVVTAVEVTDPALCNLRQIRVVICSADCGA